MLQVSRRVLQMLAIALVFAGVTGWTSQSALACSCAEQQTPLQARDQAEEVFSGVVADITGPHRAGDLTVHFTVLQAWKGIDQPEIRVATPSGTAACGIPFEEDNEYLVYTHELPLGPGPATGTGSCERTTELSIAGEDLAALGEGTPADLLTEEPSTLDTEPEAQITDDGNETERDDGLDLLILFGSIGLFLAIVVAITLLRRWR